jgi:ATP-dependent exoDNAse (exonuclease V) alpha subunit
MTIHRLLEYSPIGGPHFQRNGEHPLDATVVIVDEVSMLDLRLANNLLKAISPYTHVLLVGDADQLPSVGSGRVLRDIQVLTPTHRGPAGEANLNMLLQTALNPLAPSDRRLAQYR